MIPKIIHYCWFGGNPLPRLAEKCIKSWKKYCKGYEIREWNEKTFDIASAPLYVRQAYEAKKWAFVTDYVRLYAMTTFGGIYMDTDVEVVKKLDNFLVHQAFSGFESDVDIPTGIMACEKDFPLFLEFLRYYDTAQFYNDDGSVNMTTNVVTMTNICLEHGLVRNGCYQEVDGFALYPRDVFCPVDCLDGKMHRTKRTAAIHWFNGSWLPEETQKAISENKKKRKQMDRRDFIRYLPNRVLMRMIGQKTYGKIRSRLREKK